jgi:hypothetical protein
MLLWHENWNWAIELMHQVPGAERYEDERKWFEEAISLTGQLFC